MNTTIQEFVERLKMMPKAGENKSGDNTVYKKDTVNKSSSNKTQGMIDALRVKREEICFAIVNRGQVWYESLTAVQRAELLLWYNAWLNVTETLTIPDTPCWIK